MMNLELCCAMCGKEKTVRIDTEGFNGGTTPFKTVIEKAGWITQQNDRYFDIYCSKRCAK